MINEIRETNFNFVRGDTYWTFSSTDYIWVNKIRLFLEKNPQCGTILHENADGSIVARLYVNAINFAPHAKKVMTEEEKKKLSERMSTLRKGVAHA